MYRNWDIKTAKWYLVLSNLIFFGALCISLIIVAGLYNRGLINIQMSSLQKVALSLVCGIIPTASFCGFCTFFIRINQLSKNQILIMIIFCIPLVASMLIFGTVMLAPTGINALKIIKNT